jgi:hypothetical protein
VGTECSAHSVEELIGAAPPRRIPLVRYPKSLQDRRFHSGQSMSLEDLTHRVQVLLASDSELEAMTRSGKEESPELAGLARDQMRRRVLAAEKRADQRRVRRWMGGVKGLFLLFFVGLPALVATYPRAFKVAVVAVAVGGALFWVAEILRDRRRAVASHSEEPTKLPPGSPAQDRRSFPQ